MGPSRLTPAAALTRRTFLGLALAPVVGRFLPPRPPVLPSLALRFVRSYDVLTDSWPVRMDVLYGWATVRPELAARVSA